MASHYGREFPDSDEDTIYKEVRYLLSYIVLFSFNSLTFKVGSFFRKINALWMLCREGLDGDTRRRWLYTKLMNIYESIDKSRSRVSQNLFVSPG
jgi:hypothetical protein